MSNSSIVRSKHIRVWGGRARQRSNINNPKYWSHGSNDSPQVTQLCIQTVMNEIQCVTLSHNTSKVTPNSLHTNYHPTSFFWLKKAYQSTIVWQWCYSKQKHKSTAMYFLRKTCKHLSIISNKLLVMMSTEDSPLLCHDTSTENAALTPPFLKVCGTIVKTH